MDADFGWEIMIIFFDFAHAENERESEIGEWNPSLLNNNYFDMAN